VHKLSPEFDWRNSRIVLRVNPSAHPFAGFQQRYLNARRGEIAGRGEARNPGADYQN
jgi:hypothetical protein